MTIKDSEKGIQPTDPTDEISETEAAANATDDTEGHSLLTVELDRANRQDRARETNKIVRDGARVREANSKDEGGFLKRFRRG